MNIHQKSIYEIPNPYDHTRPVRTITEFAGRISEIDDIEKIFNDVESGLGLNVAIYGERASGKTSLLNIIKEIANNKGGITAKIDLNDSFIESDLDLLVAIFDSLIEDGANKGLFGDEGEESIYFQNWRENIDYYEIGDKSKQFLRIGPIFANSKQKKLDYVVNPNMVEGDFSKFISNSEENGIPFAAIFIDEADLFYKNKGILELIRNIIQNVTKIIFVLSGTNKMFELIDTVFSPIPRQFRKIQLNNFRQIHEAIDCIYKPLFSQGIKTHEITSYINYSTIEELFQRTGGNPYHIKLLSHFMFEHFQQDEDNKMIVINSEVLSSVYENISKISESSNRVIHKQLLKLSDEQLKSLGFLSAFNGLDLRSAGTLFAAIQDFETFSSKNLEDCVLTIIDNYKKIDSCRILEILKIDGEIIKPINQVKSKIGFEYGNMSDSNDAIIYFLGDHLDSLYLEHFLEKRFHSKHMVRSRTMPFIDNLFTIFQNTILDNLLKRIKNNVKSYGQPIMISKYGGQLSTKDKEEILSFSLIKSFSELLNTLEKKDTESAYESASQIGLANIIRMIVGKNVEGCMIYNLSGYLKNDPFFIRIFIPLIKGENTIPSLTSNDKFCMWQPEEVLHSVKQENLKKLDYKSYDIEIHNKQIIFLNDEFVNSLGMLDLSERVESMHSYVRSGRYITALSEAKLVVSMSSMPTFINNLGFIYLLLDDYNNARKSFDRVLKKTPGLIITLYNYKYLNWVCCDKSDIHKVEKELRRFLKQIKKINSHEKFILKVPLCSKDLICDFDTSWDLFSDVGILVATYIALSTLLLSRKHISEAYTFFNKAKNIDPNCYLIERYKAWIRYNSGEKEKARDITEKLIEQNKYDQDLIKKQLKMDLEFFIKNTEVNP
jgi:tetratricopeptide (TPR) repeat protein